MTAILVSLVMVACGGGATSSTQAGTSTTIASLDPVRAELEAAMERWEASGLTTYSYRFAEDCVDCVPAAEAPRDAVVWDGEELDPGDQNPSVDEMFRRIEMAIITGTLEDVVYHPELGIPTAAVIAEVEGDTGWKIDDVSDALPGDDVELTELDLALTRWQTNRPHAYSYVVSVLCDCPLEQSMRTVVVGDEIVDWEAVFAPQQDDRLSPTTIDDLFGDIRELLAAGEAGLEEDEFSFSGSSRFHPVFGYPTWIGLELTAGEGFDLAALGLAERIVFTLTEVEIDDGPASEGEAAMAELEFAKERWQNRWFGSYTYELTVHDVVTADFTGPYAVIVAGDVSVTMGGKVGDPDEVPYLTMEEIFALAEAQIAEGGVDVIFHAELGYPVLVQYGSAGTLLAIANVQSLR